MPKKSPEKKGLKAHKEFVLFFVLFPVLVVFLTIGFFTNSFSLSSLTGNAITDVGGISPNYVLAILIFTSSYALIVGYFIRTKK